ncbi:LicD family protein [Eubacterium sp. 1001713B170207_170306_E7]|uniref:LicD family protein n=1 Tax=Eubacterium sp. 1001713B170207_170306_E7 TaxID=2787097 RepID=UPI00189A2FCD|nr:LicD family protein [Eubacterium sp. 1001713B170207_170306_E7]
MNQLSLKQIQYKSLEILKKVDNICTKNNLTYFLAYGTLIGAVRHKGFIPWDDDIDIMMPRKDYNLLLQYFYDNQKSIYPLKVLNVETTKNYPYMIARIIDDRFTVIENRVKVNYGLGLFIDIYPLDALGENTLEIKYTLRKTNFYVQAIKCFLPEDKNLKGLNHYKAIVLRMFISKSKEYYIKKLISIIKKKNYERSKCVGCVVWENDCYEKSLVEKTMKMKFEDAEFPVPVGYHEMLTQIYGNYMELPPENERIGHHEYQAFVKDQYL